MTSRATAEAAANIAFIKYWGARDLSRAVPNNPSISMTLSRCCSQCTAEFVAAKGDDEIWLVDAEGRQARPDSGFSSRIQTHLFHLKEWAGREGHFRIATRNTFPSATGLASSASGFAALTLAATRAMELDPSTEELSSLARLSGSGSAARSVLGGFVEWPAGSSDDECHAVSLAPADHWDLRDVVAIVESGTKPVSSRDGHARAATSPYYKRRQELLPARLDAVRQAIEERSFTRLGPLVEEEGIDLHLIAMSSRPPIFYWRPGTIHVLEAVRQMRFQGLKCCATMDAGANVHVLCPPGVEEKIAVGLRALPAVRSVIRDRIGYGPSFLEDDLLG